MKIRLVQMKTILRGLRVYEKCWPSWLAVQLVVQLVVVGNANPHHKQIFIKYICRVSSQSLQTFQPTEGLEFRCRFLVCYY